ncbi:hypothetical protein B0H17DRAFT_1140117 [Mycena rosella]|uniref:Uncharacterized protein n=1 Tax=Mycena rosella TaxID=1033263 RepID=A0AAD7D2P2_MYCRO|nr:hypothetical protein B0H17DRAFT_1140117 [Mycena rosella]
MSVDAASKLNASWGTSIFRRVSLDQQPPPPNWSLLWLFFDAPLLTSNHHPAQVLLWLCLPAFQSLALTSQPRKSMSAAIDSAMDVAVAAILASNPAGWQRGGLYAFEIPPTQPQPLPMNRRARCTAAHWALQPPSEAQTPQQQEWWFYWEVPNTWRLGRTPHPSAFQAPWRLDSAGGLRVLRRTTQEKVRLHGLWGAVGCYRSSGILPVAPGLAKSYVHYVTGLRYNNRMSEAPMKLLPPCTPATPAGTKIWKAASDFPPTGVNRRSRLREAFGGPEWILWAAIRRLPMIALCAGTIGDQYYHPPVLYPGYLFRNLEVAHFAVFPYFLRELSWEMPKPGTNVFRIRPNHFNMLMQNFRPIDGLQRSQC